MLTTSPSGASSNIALWRAKIKAIALLITVFMEIPRRSITDNDGVEIGGNKKPEHEIVIKTIMLFLVGGIFIGLMVLIVTKYRTLLWIITLFAIPVYLQYFTDAYISVGIIRTIVNTNSCEKLSQKEREAINSFAYIIWFLGLFKFYDFVFDKSVQHLCRTISQKSDSTCNLWKNDYNNY